MSYELGFAVFYVFIYLSIIIVTVFNYVCVSAFEQGHLDPWRSKSVLNYYIIIIIKSSKKTSASVAVTGWLGVLLKDLCATTIQQLSMVSVVDTYRLVVLGVLYKTVDYYPLTGVLVSVLYMTADYYPLAKKVLPLLRWYDIDLSSWEYCVVSYCTLSHSSLDITSVRLL